MQHNHYTKTARPNEMRANDVKQYYSKQDMLLVGKGYEIRAELRRLMIREGRTATLSVILQKQQSRAKR